MTTTALSEVLAEMDRMPQIPIAAAWKRRIESALASAEPVCYASAEMLRPLREGDENSAEVILWREKGQIHDVALYTHAQPAAKVEAPSGLAVCPVTGRKFFSNVEHPELGMVATYGGPFDSYTVPTSGPDDELRSERYDWDADRWVEGGEPVGYFYEDQQEGSAPTPASVPDGFREHGNSALAHISNALDDLDSSPDQRPVPLLNEAMFHIREMLSPTNQEGAAP